LKASHWGRDCLRVAEAHLLESGWAESALLAHWRQEAVETVEAAVAKVQREPGPDPYNENWCALASKHLSEGSYPADGPSTT
jgi:pyruvate dehydrogenase E1 component alpha subunit/2-oxoisovalerate dehydrogenase E1 component alpha subunit